MAGQRVTRFDLLTPAERAAYDGTWASFVRLCEARGWEPQNCKKTRRALDRARRLPEAATPAHEPAGSPFDPESAAEAAPAEAPGKPKKPADVFADLEAEHRERVADALRRLALEGEERALRHIPAPRAQDGGRKKHRVTVVLGMTDLHYGKRTSTFDREIFARRLERIGANLAELRDLIAAEHEIDKLVIAMLGDWNDGSGIYPGQAHHQDVSNAEAQAWDLSGLLAPWLRAQADVWGAVEGEAVPGNHGRTGKGEHEAASWDIVTYRYLASRLGERVPIRMNATGSPFIRKVPVYGHNLLLHHGHEIKMHMSIPWYGLQLRLGRWATGGLAPFDVAMFGHFHTVGYHIINRVHAFLGGTMVTDDSWALETLGYESGNKWWLFGMSERRPVTFQFGVDLAGAGLGEAPITLAGRAR